MIKSVSGDVPKFQIYEFSGKKNKYCVGIPIINEGEKIQKQLQRMKKYSKLADIIIFDGGSTDGSLHHSFLKKNGVRTLLVMQSNGRQGTQLRMGFSYALKQGYKGIITIDGNGKDDVSAIPSFINKLDEKYDFIQGSRFISSGKAINTPTIRWFAIRFIHAPLISLAAKFWYTDTTNGFRGYSIKYLMHDKLQPFRNIFNTYDLLFYLNVRAPQLGLKVTEIPVIRSYPVGKIPTKIGGSQNIDIIVTLLRLNTGYYNP